MNKDLKKIAEEVAGIISFGGSKPVDGSRARLPRYPGVVNGKAPVFARPDKADSAAR